jgi:hypothetical protein
VLYALCFASIPILLAWRAFAIGLIVTSAESRGWRGVRAVLVGLLALLSVGWVAAIGDRWYAEVWSAAGPNFSVDATKKTGLVVLAVVAVSMGVLHYFVTGRPKPLSEMEQRRIEEKTKRTVERLMKKHGKTGGEEGL